MFLWDLEGKIDEGRLTVELELLLHVWRVTCHLPTLFPRHPLFSQPPPYPPSGGNAARMKFPGDDEYKHAIPLLSLCHGILTNWSILSIPFLSKKKGSSGLAAQEQLALCDWSWHSHGRRIPAKLDLEISRTMNVPWRECSGVACSYPLAPGLWPSILASLKGACRAVFKWLLKIITRLRLQRLLTGLWFSRQFLN